MKKIQQRTCLGCNTKKNKHDLIRIVKSKEGKVSIDKDGKKEGRGAYICNSIECLESVVKKKRLEKMLRIKIECKIYDELRGEMLDK